MTVQTTPPPPEAPAPSTELATFLAQVALYTAAEELIRTNLFALILRFFRRVTNPYDPDQVREYGERVAEVVRAAQKRELDLAVAQQRRLLVDLGVDLPKFATVLPDAPRGVDPVEVAQRALREARTSNSNGLPLAQALERGQQRALVMAGDDLDLASREGHRQALERTPAKVIGYRRVIHPELSRTGSCGLCVAASDRVYAKDELLPVHARCSCSVAPLTTEADPADEANAVDLAQLYKLAGKNGKSSTAGKDLKKVRFTIDEHGELGAQLRPRSKGADDPAAQIAQIDRTLKGLGVWGEQGKDVGAARDAQLDFRSDQSQR